MVQLMLQIELYGPVVTLLISSCDGMNLFRKYAAPTKSDGKIRRSYLKGIKGDAMNVLLSACGQNMRKVLMAN